MKKERLTKKVRYGIFAGIIIILGGLFAWYKVTPGPYDNLAQCLTEQGAKFYGTFWCPFCQQQKKAFAKSANKLPYIECSTPDKKTLQICVDAEIENYPTWIFPDGSIEKGVRTPEYLAEKMSCPLS